MLTERLIKAGAKIKQLNTDGILYLFNKNKLDKLNQIIKDWETETKLSMETEEFERFYQFAINDYLGVSKGYEISKDSNLLKKKGFCIDKVILGKGMNSTIIPEAINKFLADGIPIETTIKECKDITKFLTYQKVDKKFSVEYNNQLIQRINRFYMSTNGAYLYKCKIDNNGKRANYIKINSKSGVTILNIINSNFKFPTNINYNYYIAEAKKILAPLLHPQLTLF